MREQLFRGKPSDSDEKPVTIGSAFRLRQPNAGHPAPISDRLDARHETALAQDFPQLRRYQPLTIVDNQQASGYRISASFANAIDRHHIVAGGPRCLFAILKARRLDPQSTRHVVQIKRHKEKACCSTPIDH
jgi:hypothetical protein